MNSHSGSEKGTYNVMNNEDSLKGIDEGMTAERGLLGWTENSEDDFEDEYGDSSKEYDSEGFSGEYSQEYFEKKYLNDEDDYSEESEFASVDDFDDSADVDDEPDFLSEHRHETHYEGDAGKRKYQSRNRVYGRKRSKISGKVVAVIVAAAVFVLGAAAGGVLFRLWGRVAKEVTLEAGAQLTSEMLVVRGEQSPSLVTTLNGDQNRKPGIYIVEAYLKPFHYNVSVNVVDTIAPTAETNDVELYYGGECRPEDFLKNITDETEVICSFVAAPDYGKLGAQEVSVLLTDEGKNETVVTAGLWYGKITGELTIEAGTVIPEPADYLNSYETETLVSARYSEVPSEMYRAKTDEGFDIDNPNTLIGDYTLTIAVEEREVPVTLHIVDTMAPVITVTDKKVSGWTVKGLKAEEFIVDTVDASEVIYYFAEEPDWTVAGDNTAVVVAVDEGGNMAEAEVSFTLRADKVAPQVEISEIDTTIGKPVSYKAAVNCSDNADSREELIIEVDNSKVNLNAVGAYEVIYTVTDLSGNSTKVKGSIRVWDKMPEEYDENEVNRMADEVLARIVRPEMTQLEVVRAIYDWVRGHVGFINHSEKGDWVRGAYEGFVLHKGDCYVFAATTRWLLNRAGIENIDIVKSTINPSHYWHLVNVGDGWYHLDTTPRYDAATFFMVTDEELMAYSVRNWNSHQYDASLYPEIN